jgi:tetratricopeptide (TPR) repeat protein
MRCLAVALIVIGSAVLHGAAAELLNPPATVERTIAVKETVSFEIRLAKGVYVEATISAPSTLLELGLVDPSGHDVATSGTRVLTVVDNAGSYTLRVQCPASSVVGGRYVLKLTTAESPTERHVMLDRASRLRMQGESEKRTSKDAAEKSFREALRLFEATADGVGTRETLRSLGMLAYRAGNLVVARDWLGRELQSATSDRDTLSESRSAFWLGYTYLDSDPPKARAYFEQAAAGARRLGNEPVVSMSLNAAAAEYMPGDIDRGLALLAEAKEIATRLNDTWMLADIVTTEGNAYTFRGEFRRALESYEAAIPLHRAASKITGEANALSNLGEALTNIGEYKRALQTFDSAIALWKKAGNRGREMYAVHNRARVYAAQGQRELARKEFDAVTRTMHEINVPEAEASAWNEIGQTWVADRQPQKAIDCFHHAITLAETGVSERVRGHAFLLRSRAQQALGRNDEAVQDAEESLKLFQRISDRNNELLAREAVARAEFARGRLEAARDQMTTAMELIETGRAELQRKGLQGSYVASRASFTELYIQTLVATRRTSDAFTAAERFRARNLLDAVGDLSGDLLAATDPSWAAEDRRLRERLRRDAAALVQVSPPERSAVQGRIDNALQELDRLNARKRQSGGRALTVTAGETVPPEEIRRKYVDADTTLVEFFLANPKSYAWVLDSSGLRLVTLPSRRVIEAAAHDLRAALVAFALQKPGESVEDRSRRRETSMQTAAAKASALNGLVLGAISISPSRHRLAIVPDGALWYTPWSMLAATEGREIAVAPSATAVVRIRQSNRERPKRPIAIFADPVYGRDDPRMTGRERDGGSILPATLRTGAEQSVQAHFARLRFSNEEALAVSDVASRSQLLRALGFDATRALASSPELANYRAVHFAAHAVLNNEHPELSGIVLSMFDRDGRPQDGFLRLFDVYALRLNADLVVLSGCETALGKELRGEGLVGLTQGFLAAGADHVLATLWPVEDRATAEFMKRFYRFLLKDSMRPAAALAATRSSMRAEPAWSAPYYWAGFQLIGDWR